MNWLKAVFVVLLGAGLTLYFGAEGVIPLPDAGENFAIGVVGLVGLGIGAVLRALGAVLVPLVLVGRVLIVPAALAGLVWLVLRRRAR